MERTEITELLGEDEKVIATIQKDSAKDEDEGLLEIYKRLRPGEPPTVESARTLLNNLFFDPRRFDLAKFGRFKFNKKLSLANRLNGFISDENIVNPHTGEIIISEGEKLTGYCRSNSNAGINQVTLILMVKRLK